jgi:zinc transporter 2
MDPDPPKNLPLRAAGIVFNALVFLVLGEHGHLGGGCDHDHGPSGGDAHAHGSGGCSGHAHASDAPAHAHSHGSGGCAGHAHGNGTHDHGPGGSGEAGHAQAHAIITAEAVGAHAVEIRCEVPAESAALLAQQQQGHSHGHGSGDNINLRSALVHVIGDLLQSVGVAIAGLLIWLNPEDTR